MGEKRNVGKEKWDLKPYFGYEKGKDGASITAPLDRIFYGALDTTYFIP